MRNIGYNVILAGLMLAVAVTTASAIPAEAPEINPGSISAGLALLAGGALLVRARMRK